MKIAIVDDQKKWISSAVAAIHQYYTNAEIKIEIDSFESPVEYLKNKKKYDISFIDIEMPELDGFKTIEKARNYNQEGVYIILTTHTEMSRKGYVVNAFRYIDKKMLSCEIAEALKSSEILLGRNRKIKVNIVREGEHKLVLKDVIYIETEKHNILIHTKNGVKKCSNTMSDMEKVLPAKWFYRCHNSYIVNLDEVSTLKKTIIYMSNGDDVYISKRKIWEFKRVYLERQYECANG